MKKRNEPWLFRWMHPNGIDKLANFGIIREIPLALSGRFSESQVKLIALAIFQSHTSSISDHINTHDQKYLYSSVRIGNNGQHISISVGGVPRLQIERVKDSQMVYGMRQAKWHNL